MRRLLALAAAAALCAACIDKPLKPSERPDGAPGDQDGGHDASTCDDPPDERTAWDADDVVRFDQTVAQLNGDCFDDIVVPGAIDDATRGVFIILGRSAADFFTGGYDHFIETTDSEPLRVAATDLVGDDPLDLVVFARSTVVGTIDDAEVLVFQGVGDGSFLSQDIRRRIEDTAVRSPGLDELVPIILEPVSAIDGDPVELLIGDEGATFLLSPGSWTKAGLDAADVTQPFGGAGTQGVVVAPSGRSGENDLVQVDQLEWTWFVNETDTAYSFGNSAIMADAGPRRLRARDLRSSTDIVSVSALSQTPGVSFVFVEPPTNPGDAGSISSKDFSESPIAAEQGIEAVELIGLGGGTDPELLVLDGSEAATMARLWLYHDLAEAGAEVEPAGPVEPVEVAPAGDTHPYNRMAVGSFRDPASIKVYVFSSAPGVTPPICWLPDPASGDLSRCN